LVSHTNKQNKVPLRQEGVDPDKTKGGDTFLWLQGGRDGKPEEYLPFRREDWDALVGGKSKL
jgi:hypothetical protein